MKKAPFVIIVALALAGCSRLESIPYNPPQTPESWLTIQPNLQLQIGSREILVIQPSTSTIVYLLGVIAIAAGLYFFHTRSNQSSRLWWGFALVLWGVGALLAGTSYEAFSYQIKCLAREVCIWTSWWEILYLALSVASVDAMLIAEAYSCASGKLRRGLIRYAWVNIGVYLAILLIGSQVPVKFLISFELLILVLAPNVILFLILNGWRYARLRNRMDLVLLGVWGWLILTIGAYFLYYLSGMSQRLWAQGIWFTENDVLHIGLILWMVYIALVAARWIKDEPLAI
jgi:hypothetical protein